MGKTKVGGSQGGSQSPRKDEITGSNGDNGETIEGPAAKKRKLESKKQKNGSSSSYSSASSDDTDSQKSSKSSSSSQGKPEPEVRSPPSSVSNIGSSINMETLLDGNAAERIKTASLCRQRKQVERFTVTTPVSSRDKPIIIPDGSGAKLQNIPHIYQQINNARTSELLQFHKLLYGRIGNHSEVKQRLKSFSGFGFEKSSPDFERKKQTLLKMEKPERDFLCECLGLIKTGSKENVVETILEFLLEPSLDLLTEKAKAVEKRSPSPKKSAKSTPASSAVSTPSKLSSAISTPSKASSSAATASTPRKKKPAAKGKAKAPLKKTNPKGKGKKEVAPKKGRKQAEPKSKAPAQPKKKAAAMKPVFSAKAKKGGKKANSQSLVQYEDAEEMGEAVPEDTAEEQQIDTSPSAGASPKTKAKTKKSPVKPSFKRGKSKAKNKANLSGNSSPEDQDYEMAMTSTYAE